MLYAERGNKVVSINEDLIAKYVSQGYTIKDAMGTVVQETVPIDVPNLRKSYVEQTAKIKALETENAELKRQIAELKSIQTRATAKVEKPVVEDVVSEEKPAKKAKKTATVEE